MKIFENDYENFHKVRIETRKRILANRDLEDEEIILEKICEGEEIKTFLLQNVIQGNLMPEGHYRLKARQEHVIGSTKKV